MTPTEIPDEEYSKPFLARVQLPEEENMCTSDEFQAICTYHRGDTEFAKEEMDNPAIEAIIMPSEAVTEAPVAPQCHHRQTFE